MTTIEIVFGILLLVMAAFLVFAVLAQSGKGKKLSGAISGGADTFYGKTKSSTRDRRLSLWTSVISVIFVVVVVVMYIVVG